MDGGCHYRSLRSSANKNLAFVNISLSFAVSSKNDSAKLATGRVKRDQLGTRLANSSMSKADCVQRSMLHSKTSSSVYLPVMVVSIVS